MKQLSVINIMVIEDNRRDVQLIREFLKSASFKYKLFHSPSLIGGLDLIEEKPIDLVLLDLSLDDTSGFNTLTDYLRKVENIPVIVLTGDKKESVGMKSVSAGAQDFLVKGEFNEERLASAIKYSIQRFKSQAKLLEKNQQLSIKEKRYREAQKIGKYTNWEMNIVSNKMKWSDEMFDIFGFSPQSFTPSLSDFLRYVHIEDRQKVEAFFESAIKTGELTKIKHRILVSGRQIKLLSLRVQVKYDETTNNIILFGNLQEITEGTIAQDSDSTLPEQMPSGIKLEYSAAIPKNFNFFEYLAASTGYLTELFNTDLSPHQLELLKKIALSLGNYTKLTSNFQNLLPILDQTNPAPPQEFITSEFVEDIKNLFQLQKLLSKTIVNFHLERNTSENLSGSLKDIRIALFNLILQVIAFNEGNHDINVHIEYLEQPVSVLQFSIVFKGDPTEISKTGKLSSEPNVFRLENLPTLFQSHPLDIITNAYQLQRTEATLTVKREALSTLTVTFPVEKIEKKVNDKEITLPVHFLLVEDHVMNQIVLKKTLTAWSGKISVEVVPSGKAAVDALKRRFFDLILINVNLPDMDGIETARAIRKHKETPILGISSYPSSQEKSLCLEAGMNEYLEKPFIHNQLFKKILFLLQ